MTRVSSILRRRPRGDGRARIERQGSTATIHVHGDLVMQSAGNMWRVLRGLTERRGTRKVVVDLASAGRIDSSGVALLSLGRRQCQARGKAFALEGATEHHRAALALFPEADAAPPAVDEPGVRERVGRHVLDARSGVGFLGKLLADIVRHTLAVIARRARLPHGSIVTQIARMGTDAVFIVSLLTFLLGASIAMQSVVQLNKVGAGVYVADLIGYSMIREFAPIMTAFLVIGRTGAAIAAELGTMKMRAELDALTAMGVSPIRYHVVPRLAALTIVQPILTLIGMTAGILGGIIVAAAVIDLPPAGFFSRMVERVDLSDFAHGLGKSLAFAWIIGLVGTFCGMRAAGDAASVGRAATRAVVTSLLFVVMMDAAFPTAAHLVGSR